MEKMPKIKLEDMANKEVGSNALNKLVKGTLITSLSRRDKSMADITISSPLNSYRVLNLNSSTDSSLVDGH